MGNKILYRTNIKKEMLDPLPGVEHFTRRRDYVDYIESTIPPKTDHIYKREDNEEDLSNKSDNYIWSQLKDKIYNSTLRIVLISPNMKIPDQGNGHSGFHGKLNIPFVKLREMIEPVIAMLY